MSEKKISYLSRDFSSIRNDLINFSKTYYPEMADSFNDSSVGSWLIDLAAAVGDDLSYHTDRAYQENNINSANLKSTIYNIARNNGVKICGKKASMCEVELSCVLGVDSTNISSPDWTYAPLIKQTTVVGNGSSSFQLTEDVNFGEQFNKSGFPNRKFTPSRDNNGSITGYTVSKSVIATNGTSKIYKKTISNDDLTPFMEVVLPEQNVMNVESVIFKETSNGTYSPDTYEFYVDEEEYKLTKESSMTYRFFEVDSLSDQYRFGSKTSKIDDTVLKDKFNPDAYSDYSENGSVWTRIYKGEWKSISQKFITEYTDNGYMKIIFGSGTMYGNVPSNSTKYGEYRMSQMINNDMLGVLPKAGWTMYVLYNVGGGNESNLGIGSINSIMFKDMTFPNSNATGSTFKTSVINSMSVTNQSNALAGRDAMSTEELKNYIKYNISSQGRCVTIKDYKSAVMSMPSKYGCPFRMSVMEENNKIVMSMLGINYQGKLDSSLPQTLVDNATNYLSHYKSLNDYVEMKSGRIFNIAFQIDLFIDKTYIAQDVVKSVINKIKDYMSIDNHDMGEDIFLGDLEKEITITDGVLSIISLKVYNIYGGTYSSDECPLPIKEETTDSCNMVVTDYFTIPVGSSSSLINLDEIDSVLYGSYNGMYEILNPENDIAIRFKTK